MGKRKNVRKLKVYDQCGYNYHSTLTITLKGLWLKELGFDSNTPILVKCENGRLTIEPRSGRSLTRQVRRSDPNAATGCSSYLDMMPPCGLGN